MEDINKKRDIMNRLKRIEGQVKGIQGMMEKDSCCRDILIQISAIRSAINKVGSLMIENYAYNCLEIGNDDEKEKKKLNELIRVMDTFIK